MAYRAQTEAMRLRIEELEGELAAAREIIARMQGDIVAAEVEGEKPGWWTGAPRRLHIERELPFELSASGYEAIADLLRQRWPAANISQVGGTLTCRVALVDFRATRLEGGRTQVRLNADYKGHAQLQGIGCGTASIIGMSPVVVALEAAGFSPALLVVAPLVVIAFWGVARAIAGASIRKSRKGLTGLFETVALLAAKHAKPKKRVRIGESTKSETAASARDTDAEENATAEAEAQVVAEAESAAAEAELAESEARG